MVRRHHDLGPFTLIVPQWKHLPLIYRDALKIVFDNNSAEFQSNVSNLIL